jgi:hypothetical protein
MRPEHEPSELEKRVAEKLRKCAQNDLKRAAGRHSEQSDEDPDIARIWRAFTGAEPWNEQEAEYAQRSDFVKKVWEMCERAKQAQSDPGSSDPEPEDVDPA